MKAIGWAATWWVFGASVLGACSGDSVSVASQSVIGRPCVPQDESFESFPSYAVSEVVIWENEEQCDGLICLVNHFQGRVTCPYGQTQDEIDTLAPSDPARCRLPRKSGATPAEALSVPAAPQLVQRRAADVVLCTCQCGGRPDPADNCTCPAGMVCSQVGFGGATSYCVRAGTEYEPTEPPGPTCDKSSTDPATDCGNNRQNP